MNSLADLRTYAEATDWAPRGEHRPPTTQTPMAMPVSVSRRKRAFDMALSALALLFFLPLLLTVALLIRIESPGSVLFRQRRTGLNGVIFTVFKFRTMRVEEDGAIVRQATQNDSRITALGAILRKYSIDELPQLINVLRGEMSLIGPRPHAVAHDQLWTEQVPGYARRFRTRPGLTGYAAICGFRGEVKELQAIVDRVESDNEYIDTWSFGLDLKIVLRTIPLVFSDTNAY